MVQLNSLADQTTLKDSFMRMIEQVNLARPIAYVIKSDGSVSYRGLARFLGHGQYSKGSAFKRLLSGQPIMSHSVFSLSARLNNAGFPNIPILLSLAGKPLLGDLLTRCEMPVQEDILAPKAFDYFTSEYLRDVVRARRLTPGAYISQARAGSLVGTPNTVCVIENAGGSPSTDRLENLFRLLGVEWDYFVSPAVLRPHI